MNDYLSLCNDIFSGKKGVTIKGEDVFKKDMWPKGYGIYMIYRGNEKDHELIYIGMTGKVKSDGSVSKTSDLFKRVDRWTPYNFYKADNCLYFDTNPANPPKDRNATSESYSDSEELKNIFLRCYACEDMHPSPSFIEAVLLQKYYDENNCLPLINNEF